MLVSVERCNWCGAGLGPGDGWRAWERSGAHAAGFCRLEHIVPWAMQGARWDAGTLEEPVQSEDSLTECSLCGEPLADRYVLLVRHRGEHRIPDAFCSADHMAEWAKRGGRWAP
jgi:hypothetical protein